MVKILSWVTPASGFRVQISLGAMLEGFVTIPNIIEEVELILPREKRRTYAVYRRITPTLVIEAALFIQIVKELGIGFISPKVHIGNLEVTPEMTTIIGFTPIIGQEGHGIVHGRQTGIRIDKGFDMVPQRRNSFGVLKERDGEPINFLLVLH